MRDLITLMVLGFGLYFSLGMRVYSVNTGWPKAVKYWAFLSYFVVFSLGLQLATMVRPC